MESAAKNAREASLQLAVATNEQKNAALELVKQKLLERKAQISKANAKDIDFAEKNQMPGTLVKRLFFSEDKLQSCIAGISTIIRLEDPVGRCELATELQENLMLYRVTCPVGVVGVVYEARPEAGIQIASLCIKAGCALLLKGGKEAIYSNHAIYEAIQEALTLAPGIPKESVQLLDSRDDVSEMLKQTENIDLVVARGSYELVRYIQDNTKIPVLGHSDGLCSVYVDESADMEKALSVVEDSKLNYPSACNAVETILIHDSIYQAFLPKLAEKLPTNMKYWCCSKSRQLLPNSEAATEKSYHTEFLGHEAAVKVVASLEEAIQHINFHGSRHTDVIITEAPDKAKRFLAAVDSSGVFWNASSRFADGFRFGFGAELGISTGKLHARGPVGLEGLVTYKFKVFGQGHTVGSEKEFIYKPILEKNSIKDPMAQH
eukprot:GHVP01054376.1.p1 GENE.GHVP01054376.1~~GHVP01054376.1.p1  ORF type:complete len:434 (+),score=83.18 GHVP01054376.1:1136-2437(+)